jgi:hypothetical protein
MDTKPKNPPSPQGTAQPPAGGTKGGMQPGAAPGENRKNVGPATPGSASPKK